MLIITPNRRLAAFSLRQKHHEQLLQKHKAWETAQIHAIEEWLLQLWQLSLEVEPQNYKTLVNSTQQQILVERLIQESDVGVELLRAAATAKNVLQAWKFLRQWQVPAEALDAYSDYIPDTAVFAAWMRSYQTWLQQHNYIDFELMVDHLILILPKLRAQLPKKICLRGFNEIVPQYAALVAQLAALDIEITTDQLIHAGATVFRTRATNAENELQTAALWALQNVQEQPDAIVGVVVPELSLKRKQVEAVFKSIIPHEWLNISAPLALTEYGLIDSALLILQLAKPQIKFTDISVLLRSPYIIAAQQQRHRRAGIDKTMRAAVEAKLSWQRVLNFSIDSDPELSTAINNFVYHIANNQGLHDTRYWAQQIQVMLQAWGWPGDGPLTIAEADLHSCWTALIDEYIKLAGIIPAHSFAVCLQIIQRLALETPFAAAETGLTRVHVLGVLEADGLAFDKLWVTGMDRDTWPQIAEPNPFIPLELQRKYDLPKSSPQRELKVAQRLTNNLMQGAKQAVVFSFAAQQEENQSVPSNLIVHLAEQNIYVAPKTELKHIAELEQLSDPFAPAIVDKAIKGGTSILRLQAQCPFRANAVLRLGAVPLEEPQEILNAAQRGNIIHLVLEKFWRDCTARGELLNHSMQLRAQKLKTIIHDVLTKLQTQRPFTLTENYVQLEKQHTLNVISKWLQYEAERDDFQVLHLEKSLQINIGPLQIMCKIDRVDRLSEGGLAVIDYKTGFAQPADWFSVPILEPQLPLYAITQAEEVIAVVMAQVQAEKATFRGVAVTNDLLPQVDDLAKLKYAHKANTWTEQLQQWRGSLEQTAHEFASGNAQVKPHTRQVCEHCNLHSLCRIYDY